MSTTPKQPLTVVHMVPSLDRRFAGLAISPLQIAAAQAQSGLTVHIGGRLTEGDTPPAGDWSTVRICALNSFRSRLQAYLKLRNRRDVVVHCHGIWSWPTRLIPLLGSTAYVVSPHGMLEPNDFNRKWVRKRLYWWLFERHLLARANGLHALTELEATRFLALADPSRCQVIPTPIPVPHPPAGDSEQHQRDDPILLFLGRIRRNKGVLELASAFARLQVEGKTGNWRLVIAGWSEDEAVSTEVDTIAAGCRPGTISMPGPVFGPEKDALLRSAAAFALPSHHEALPMAALESMAYGLPTGVSEECNLNDAVDAGAAVNLRLGDKLMPDLAMLLALSPDALARIGAHARDYISTHLDYRSVGQRFRNFYEFINARHAPG